MGRRGVTLSAFDFMNAFHRCGIGCGDLLMLHSDAGALVQLPPMPLEGRCALFLDSLDAVLGPEGTLVMPTFTYSFTKGEPYSISETPSTVGLLTEYFRRIPGVLRSGSPIFSVAARGRLAPEFANSAVGDCFGKGSAFDLLARHNGWLACLGCSLNRVTFVHYVEQAKGVGYRYFKDFDGTIVTGGAETRTRVRYFVRDLERNSEIDLSGLRRRLAASDCLKTATLGRVELLAVRTGDFQDHALRILAENPVGLIGEQWRGKTA